MAFFILSSLERHPWFEKNRKSAKIRIPQSARAIHFQTAIFLNRMSQKIQLKNVGIPWAESIQLISWLNQFSSWDSMGWSSENANRIPVMAPISAPILGVHFFRGHISIKNGTFCPLSSHDSSSFNDTCLLIYLKWAKAAFYGTHLHWCSHQLFHNCPKHVVCRLGIDSGSCKS
jgi:hypothetical protein